METAPFRPRPRENKVGGMADSTNRKLTLAETEAAIRDIQEGGQRVVVGDREYYAADLGDLLKLRDELAAAERDAEGRMFIRVAFGRVS